MDAQNKLPSQLSSVSSLNLESQDNLSKSSIWTNSFKISDYMIQNCTFSTMITFIFFVFFMFQIYVTSVSHPFFTYERGRDNIFYYFYIVAFFHEQTDIEKVENGNDFSIQFIVYTVLFIISLIILLYAFISFKITRQMNSIVFYIVRFLNEYVGLILLYPLSSLAGQIGHKIINIDEYYSGEVGPIPGLSVLAFVLLLIYIIYFTCVSNYFYGASSSSIYIDHSYFMSFGQYYFRVFLLLNQVVIFLQPLLMGIENWGFISVCILHLIIVVYEIIHQTYLPFQFAFSNILLSGVLYAMIIEDVFSVVIYFGYSHFEPRWSLIVFILALAVGIVISTIVYNQIKRRKEKKLFYDMKKNAVMGIKGNGEINRMTDDEKLERFTQMNLSSPQNALFYLHYGLHDMSDMFLDMSLIQYIVQNERTKENIINCLRFVIVFPTHIRIANQLMFILKKMGGFTLFDRFIIFQVRKVRILRQSSSSMQSTEQLHEISRLSQLCQSKVSNFYSKRFVNCGLLSNIYSAVSNVNGLFKESLISYANSTLYREEYINFLIDGQSDFIAAIVETKKREMLETGVSFAKDLCFKAFVTSYDRYLRDKVLSSRGQFLTALKSDGSVSSLQTDSKHISSSGEFELHAEEDIGKTIINQARIRIAMQNAIRGKKADYSKVMITYLILSLIASVIIFSVTFGVLLHYFDHRYSSTQRSMKSSYTLMYFVTSNLANLLAWGNQTGSFVSGVNREKQWYTHESPYIGFFDYDLTYSQNALWFQKRGQNMYIDLTSDFSSFASENVDRESVHEMSSPLVNPSVNLTLCHEGQPAMKVRTGLAMAITFVHVSQASLAKNTDYNNWFSHNNDFCHCISINSDIADAMNDFRLGIVNEEKKSASQVKKFLKTLTISIPIVFAFYSFVLFIIFALLYMHEVQTFATNIFSFEKPVLEEASSSLNLRNRKMNNEKSEMNSNQERSSNYLIVLYIIGYFCLIAVVIILFVVDNLNADTLNMRFQSTTIWSLRSSVRMPFTLISLQSLLLALFITPGGKRSVKTNITTSRLELLIYRGYIDYVVESSNFLIQGDEETPELLGFDPVIDDILTKTQCEPDPGNVSMHETYRCNSLNQLIYYYDRLSNDIANEITKYDGYVFGKMPGEIPHLVLNHIIPNSVEINNRFDHLVVSFLENYKTMHAVIYVIQLIIICLVFLLGFLLWKHFNNAYNTALLLLRRISPIAVVSNTKLLKYILDISSNDKVNEMSTSESIVKNSSSAIICISQMKTIDIVNKSVTSTLGYSPDQVLGQTIDNIFDEESAKLINQKIDLMMAKQCPLYYESHVICINDNDAVVPCMLMMIGIESDEKELSFVIVLNEESELIEQQKKAEDAKARSEQLLYNILPRNIVARINSGEKDISFTVEKATICFIDFVKFSEHSAHLTPKEIMGHLSAFFGAYDLLIMKYEHLMKIKLIGDVYMCAGGIFSPDISPNVHAEQMINFTLDVLAAIEDLNLKLSTLLTVRIGINTGGPIIAGVLGTDKPVFDIIGDPINIASRLQSTDIPGQIQISKDTYEIIGQNDFNVEPRGEVYLKGKGNQMVYIVKP